MSVVFSWRPGERVGLLLSDAEYDAIIMSPALTKWGHSRLEDHEISGENVT